MRSLPEEPVRALSKDEVKAFRSDGITRVRQVLPARWIEVAAAAIERTKQTPSKTGKALSKSAPGFLNDIFMLVDDGYRRFVFESLAARRAQQVMGSRTVTFCYDQVFVKEPGTDVPTPWRHDLTFWPIEGTQIRSIWMPIDPVTRESSGLEYVLGSHRWNRRFKAVSPDYRPALLTSDLEDPPDISARRADYDLVNWDMEPGDVLIFHPLTLHGSRGNSSLRRRRAFATRWLGDDVIYAPVKARMPLPKGHGLVHGDKIERPLFPAGARLVG
jgi:ectoine hydroxylase-related dioxygenase (phytanoyl-CoA dioxygenase family)